MAIVLLIAVGGALGANARFLVTLVVARHWGVAFPWGTLLVNISGSFLLGLLLALPALRGSGPRALLATGFCGGYTTFSTFAVESVLLGGARPALANLLGSAGGCIAAAAVGGAVGLVVGG